MMTLKRIAQRAGLILLVCGLAFAGWAQSGMTTVILLRHAEKMTDGSKDPGLTPEGQERAGHLATMMASQKVDAIYSTNFQRTKNTVAPLAKAKGLEIQLYEANKEKILDDILSRHKGETIVIVGHSNTTPWTANYLMGNHDLKDFADDEYGNLMIITIPDKGKGKLVWIKY